VDIYAAARRLGKILYYEYSFPDKLCRHGITAYPEVQILSLIVIATKLCHPFDDIVRVPESLTDSSAIRIDWDGWRDIMREKPVKGFRKGEQVEVTDADVFQMSEKKLDEYLDWYQRTWIDDRDPKCELVLLDSEAFDHATLLIKIKYHNNSSTSFRCKISPQKILGAKTKPTPSKIALGA
jgi:RNA polymerase I-specific transcription initiation factor RRN7